MLTRITALTTIFIITLAALLAGSSESDPKWAELIRSADSLLEVRSLDSAIVLGRKALMLAELQLPENDTAFAGVLFKLGLYLRADTNFGESEIYLNRALATRENVLGREHPVVAQTIFDLARLHNMKGNHSYSEQLHRQALTLRLKLLDPDDPAIAESYNFLALVCRNQNKLFEAEEYYDKSIEIREKSLGGLEPDLAGTLLELGVVLGRQGRLEEARQIYLRCLGIYSDLYGHDDIRVGRCLSNLGSISCSQGDFAAAEDYFRQSLKIKRIHRGERHPDVALNLWFLGELYCNTNNFGRAEELLTQALDIYIEVFGENHPVPAQLMNALGLVYHKMGKFEKAEKYLLHSHEITAGLLGEDHLNVITCCLDLSLVYRDGYEYFKADSLLAKALGICEKIYPSCHPMTAEILNNLALVYLKEGLYGRSRMLIDSSLNMRVSLFGQEHTTVADCYETYSDYFNNIGEVDSAFVYAGRACDIKMSNFDDNALYMSEKDALIFSRLYKNSMDKLLTRYFELNVMNDAAAKSVADIILCGKGQVSDRIFERRRTIAKEDNPEIKSIAKTLQITKFDLSHLFVEGFGQDTISYQWKMDSLMNLADSLESELSRLSASYRRQKDYRDIRSERVAERLPDNAALIEFLAYNKMASEPTASDSRYLAAIIRVDHEPVIIDLGRAAEIDSVVEEYRQHMFTTALQSRQCRQSDLDAYRSICAELSEKIWKPVSIYISDYDLLLMSPDGKLNNISFAGLIDDSGRFLIEKYIIHYLSAGRDILRQVAESETGKGLFAIGDPDYDASVNARVTARKNGPVGPSIPFAYGPKSMRSGCGALNEIMLEPLPGTRQELKMIAASWEKFGSGPASIHMGEKATEDCFKKKAPGNEIIHLATHGYFLEGVCTSEPQGGISLQEDKWAGENPLLQSGLFFAGANLHGQGADSAGIDDGILTAYEVSALDLDGTRIVVLSACETGLGRIHEGEGVYGLRRAFQMAGARTVVSALWPVSDRLTSELFSSFYERNGFQISKAMREVQLKKLKELRSTNKIDHPADWAAFVVMGDWR